MNGYKSKEIFVKELAPKVIDYVDVKYTNSNRGAFYAARTNPENDTQIVGYVCSYEDREGETFFVHDVWEIEGPLHTACPSQILDLLTPNDEFDQGDSWRNKARDGQYYGGMTIRDDKLDLLEIIPNFLYEDCDSKFWKVVI